MVTKPVVCLAHRDKVPETPVVYTDLSLNLIYEMLKEAVLGACDFSSMVRGKTVFIKPNLVRPNPTQLPAVTTDPRVVMGMIRLAQEIGAAKVQVGENPGFQYNSRAAFEDWGVRETLENMGAEIIYLDEDTPVEVSNPTGRVMMKMKLPQSVLQADCFINIPKMKTHMHALVTLGIKNLHGLVFDESRLMFHRNDIAQKIVDIYRVAKPHLTVIDGLWAMEGQAPLSGGVIPDMNLLAAGTDTVAVDSVCSELMMIAPEEVDAIRIAGWEGLGVNNLEEINITGADPKPIQKRFKRPVLSGSGVYPNLLCIEGGTCKGCLSAMRHALDKLNRDGLLEKIPPFTIYVGVPMPNVKNLQNSVGDIWIYGNCAVNVMQQDGIREKHPHFIYGCAPHIFDLYALLKKTYLDAKPARQD